MLLWFYFIWGPWCYCLFWIRALFALVTGYCGDTLSAMPVTKKYDLLYFEFSQLVLGTCCCFLVFCRCLLVVQSDPSSHLLRPWRLWSPPLRSVWGDGVWLSMAAYYPQPSMNPGQHNLCHEQQPCSLCNPSNRPARRFNFTCNGSAGVAGIRGSDQPVAAIAFKCKLNGPASTKSPSTSSQAPVTPCGTVHFFKSSGSNRSKDMLPDISLNRSVNYWVAMSTPSQVGSMYVSWKVNNRDWYLSSFNVLRKDSFKFLCQRNCLLGKLNISVHGIVSVWTGGLSEEYLSNKLFVNGLKIMWVISLRDSQLNL